jgi:hypothetical protein
MAILAQPPEGEVVAPQALAVAAYSLGKMRCSTDSYWQLLFRLATDMQVSMQLHVCLAGRSPPPPTSHPLTSHPIMHSPTPAPPLPGALPLMPLLHLAPGSGTRDPG